jgi:hypothetical protein
MSTSGVDPDSDPDLDSVDPAPDSFAPDHLSLASAMVPSTNVQSPHPSCFATFVLRSRACRFTSTPTTSSQGFTLVHFLAQCKRFLWDRGCD